jgi:3-dehydroshikimate dehydratase
MIRLTAFADEISADLDEQIAALHKENIHFLELRGAWNTNVLDFTDQQVQRIAQTLSAQDISVSAIGSPIGKVPINSSFAHHLERFERAIELAHVLQTRFIRVFSFYPPTVEQNKAEYTGDSDHSQWREEVLSRLRELTAKAHAANITLLHENEKDIYGDTIARCVDLFQNVNDTHFQAILDPANFIQCGQTPFPDGYQALQPWLRYIHVKDARPDGRIVAAGEGVAHWPELLQRLQQDRYDGFFSLEPHLAQAEQFQGFSGPELFRHASQAFQQLLKQMGWDYM